MQYTGYYFGMPFQNDVSYKTMTWLWTIDEHF